LFVSLELSRSTWVTTALVSGSSKMSKHTLAGGDACKLLDLLARLKSRAEQRIAAPVKVVAIQEVGLDGFWIHRLLEANGVESHVVDPASIAVPRRHRRAKTDAIDGETLLRTLMAWQRGEPRVCAMTVPPSPIEEDRRRTSRERATLLRERIRHTNRIRGLLFGQGITNYNPLHKTCRRISGQDDGHPGLVAGQKLAGGTRPDFGPADHHVDQAAAAPGNRRAALSTRGPRSGRCSARRDQPRSHTI
jgi:transposase